MESKYIGLGVLAVVVLAGIFVITSGQQEVTCNDPYIKVGDSCCLDANDNGICDEDETTAQQAQEEKTTEETEGSCEGVTCPDYCEGKTRYYNGQCENGECSYASQECENGCKNGHCLTYSPGNGICESGERESKYACIDCEVCTDHTYMCVGTKSGGVMGQPTTTTYECQQTSLQLDDRGFYIPSNWENVVSSLDTNEFKTTQDGASLGLFVRMNFPQSSSTWKANSAWETYLTDVKSQINCYRTDGSYAMGEGETYNGIELDDYFHCSSDNEVFSCEPLGQPEIVSKLGSYSDNSASKTATYFVHMLGSNVQNKPFTLDCKVEIWSGDMPSDKKEEEFTIHFA